MANSIYPLDITGQSPANRVTNEVHTIKAADGRLPPMVIPHHAPFFKDGLVVRHGPANNQTQLTLGVHYELAYKFIEAERKLGKDVYAAIWFRDPNMGGQVTITQYQVLGSDFAPATTSIILERTAELSQNFITITYDQIIGVPYALPPIAHQHDLMDTRGYDDLEEAVRGIETAIEAGNATLPALVASLKAIVDEHVQDQANPHGVNANTVQLGNVRNYGMVDAVGAIDKAKTDGYTSPWAVYTMISHYFTELLKPHADNRALHPQNLSDIGAPNLKNWAIATNTQAMQGTGDAYMNPAQTHLATLGAMKAPSLTTLPSQFLGIAAQFDPANAEAPVPGSANSWICVNLYSGTGLNNPPTLSTRRYQFMFSPSGSGTYFRVLTNASSVAWRRLDAGEPATAGDVYTERDGRFLTAKTVKEQDIKASASAVVTTQPRSFLGHVGFFNGSTDLPAPGTWRVENMFMANLTAAPTTSTPRIQLAIEMITSTVADGAVPRIFTRSFNGATPHPWVQSGSNLRNVPDWEPAVDADMVANTTVNNKFVAPKDVKTYVDNRLGNVNKITVSSSAPTSLANGELWFQY